MRWALRLAFLASVDGLAMRLRLPAPGAGVALRRTPALVMQSDLSPQTNTDPVVSEGAALAAEFAAAVPAPVVDDDDECSVVNPEPCVDIKRTGGKAEHFFEKLGELQEGGAASILLIAVTALSLTLANNVRTSAWWLSLWGAHVGPAIGGHALSVRAWINEGLMSVFFFTVGLEIKHELRHGSLASIKAALLPCMAALGGMVTPMAVYAIAQLVMPGGSMGAIAVPMATDIAFALGVLGFFRTKMPAAATAFLLTLATVDDLGAILVLATCFAKNVAMPFLGAAAAITATLTAIGRSGSSDIKPFAVGGVAMWWCLLRAGVAADIAGVVAALCISTNAYAARPARPPPAHAAARPAARPYPTPSSRPHHHALSSSPSSSLPRAAGSCRTRARRSRRGCSACSRRSPPSSSCRSLRSPTRR